MLSAPGLDEIEQPQSGEQDRPDPFPSPRQGQCDDTYYMGVSVNFTVASGQNEAWITFGGRFALPGADLVAGFPDSTVPVGESASFVNGTFQLSLC